MRMCVGVRWPAMSCPAGMPAPRGPRQPPTVGQAFCKPAKFALCLRPDQGAADVDNGDSSRVIPAIFQPAQSIHDDWNRILGADVPNDTTHTSSLLVSAFASPLMPILRWCGRQEVALGQAYRKIGGRSLLVSCRGKTKQHARLLV